MASTAGPGGALAPQIFVKLQCGEEYPAKCINIRVSYDETLTDIKKKVEKKLGVPAEKIQFFWHKKELVDSVHAQKTLYELDMHTGFTISGYDMRKPPHYFPGVVKEEDGSLRIVTPDFPVKGCDNVKPHTKGYLAFNGKDVEDPSLLMEE